MERLDEIREKLATVADPVAVLEAIFAYAPVGLQIYTPDGRSLLTNKAFRDLFASEPPPEYCVLRDEIAIRNGVLDIILRGFAGETTKIPATWYDPRELRQVQIAQANRVAIETTIVPLLDRAGKVAHVALFFKDVTAETLARERIESERARFFTVLDELPESVVVLSVDGMATFANRAAREILRRPIAGEAWSRVVTDLRSRRPDGTLPSPGDLPLQRAMQRGVPTLGEEYIIDTPDGPRFVLVNAVPRCDAEGRILESIAVFQDITERKRIEDRLERASRQKDEFLSIASHELRTPLTTVKTTIQLAARRLAAATAGADAEVVRGIEELIAKAERQADRMARLIDELLDVTQIDAGKLEYRFDRRDLRALVGAAAEGLRLALPTHPIELDVAPQAIYAKVDPDRIEQVLTNLVTNATRYSERGRPVRLRLARREGGEAEIDVEDRGVGIAAEDLPHVFDRFFRGAHGEGRQLGGLGLGLYISAEIVRRHGGRLTVASEVGRGSTFTVRLPAD